MTDRDHYYVLKSDFPDLEKTRILILSGKIKEALDFIIKNNIDPNGYVKGTKKGTWIPLFYCCATSQNTEPIMNYLIGKKVNPKKLPDAEPEDIEPLIFVCKDEYLKYLVNYGLTIDKSTKGNDIIKCLKYGKYERLTQLVSMGIINVNDIISNCTTIIDILDIAIKYLNYSYTAYNIAVSNDKPITWTPKERTNSTMSQYAMIIDYIFSLGSVKNFLSKDTIEYCCKYYLHEILTVIKNNISESKWSKLKKDIVPVYNTIGPLVALMRPLLNDKRYELTCKVLEISPVQEIYEAYT